MEKPQGSFLTQSAYLQGSLVGCLAVDCLDELLFASGGIIVDHGHNTAWLYVTGFDSILGSEKLLNFGRTGNAVHSGDIEDGLGSGRGHAHAASLTGFCFDRFGSTRSRLGRSAAADEEDAGDD